MRRALRSSPGKFIAQSTLLQLSQSLRCAAAVSSALVRPAAVRCFATRARAKKDDGKATQGSVFALPEALRWLRAFAQGTSEQTVSIAVSLNIDTKKPNMNVRGTAKLPHGSGKSVKVAVFAKGEKAKEARAAGADVVGELDLAQQIQEGKIDFQRVIATPDMMAVVGRVARVLGPRGLMPNPKMGTVTMNVAEAVRSSKQGQVEFKNNKVGQIMCGIGKLSFTDKQLSENIDAFIKTVTELKPAGSKGTYYHSSLISCTNGKAIPLDIRQPPFKADRSLGFAGPAAAAAPAPAAAPAAVAPAASAPASSAAAT